MASKGRSLAKFVSTTGISTVVDLNVTRANITGVSTVVDLNVTRANITGVSTVADLNVTNANITGVSTVADLNVTNANITGVNITGVSTVADLNSARVNITGVTTSVDLNVTRVTSSGVGTFGGVLVGSGSSVGIGTDNAEYPLHVIGSTYAEGVTQSRGATFAGAPGGTSEVTIGKSTEENFALLDFVGDSTYNDYGLRIMRGNGGANTYSTITHQGTGDLQINVLHAGAISFRTSNTERFVINSDGYLISNGTTLPTSDVKQINLVASASKSASIGFQRSNSLGGVTGGYSIDLGTDAALRFSVHNVGEKVRVSSAGSFGIGTNDPSTILHIQKDTSSGSVGTYPEIRLDNDEATGRSEVTFYDGSTKRAGIFCYNGDGDLRFYGASSEHARFLDTGGLAFNGDTADANALDDYEEGSWTPAFGVESGSPSWTYTSRTGLYVKIGRFIYVYMDLNWSARSGTGNILTINGFPYAPSAGGWTGVVTNAVGVSFNNWGGATGQTQLALQTYSGSRMSTSAFSSGSTTTDTRGNWSMLTTGNGKFRAVAFAYA